MALGVIVLVGSGAWAVAKKKVRVTRSFVVQGRAAVHIGFTLMLGGTLAVVLPITLSSLGWLQALVGGQILSIAIMAVSVLYAGVIALLEKRRQAGKTTSPVAENKKQP